jgi:hypothetical protein
MTAVALTLAQAAITAAARHDRHDRHATVSDEVASIRKRQLRIARATSRRAQVGRRDQRHPR